MRVFFFLNFFIVHQGTTAPYRTLLHAHKVWEDWGGCYLQWWLSTNTPSLLLTRPRTTYTEWAVTMASQCVTVGTKSMEKRRLGGGV